MNAYEKRLYDLRITGVDTRAAAGIQCWMLLHPISVYYNAPVSLMFIIHGSRWNSNPILVALRVMFVCRDSSFFHGPTICAEDAEIQR